MRLFKYFSATKWTVDSLTNSQFYFSKFNELNDPCELAISDCSKEEIILIRFKFLDPKEPNGIFCLSERNDNLHMWNQYADGHKGIVVEIETDEDKEFFKELGKVVYSGNPPIYNESMKVKDVIFTKSLDSEKELEWRVFGKNELRKINPFAIKSIIFGYRFPVACSVTSDPPDYLKEMYPNNEEKIRSFIDIERLFWGNLMPDHVNFHGTKILHGTYKLEISDKWQKPA